MLTKSKPLWFLDVSPRLVLQKLSYRFPISCQMFSETVRFLPDDSLFHSFLSSLILFGSEVTEVKVNDLLPVKHIPPRTFKTSET